KVARRPQSRRKPFQGCHPSRHPLRFAHFVRILVERAFVDAPVRNGNGEIRANLPLVFSRRRFVFYLRSPSPSASSRTTHLPATPRPTRLKSGGRANSLRRQIWREFCLL